MLRPSFHSPAHGLSWECGGREWGTFTIGPFTAFADNRRD